MHPEPYLSDDVSVGELVRWINAAHLKCARDDRRNTSTLPPRMIPPRMIELQNLAEGVERAMAAYRAAHQALSSTGQDAAMVAFD